MSEAEQRLWRSLVDASPAGFLNAGAQQILRRLIALIGVAERHEARLRRIAAGKGGLTPRSARRCSR
jgi:hypothetical protein